MLKVLLVTQDCVVVGYVRRRNGDSERLYVRRDVARVVSTQRDKGSNHETGADEQDCRQNHLHDRERVLKTPLLAARGRAATAGEYFSRHRQLFGDWNQSKQETRDDAHRERK